MRIFLSIKRLIKPQNVVSIVVWYQNVFNRPSSSKKPMTIIIAMRPYYWLNEVNLNVIFILFLWKVTLLCRTYCVIFNAVLGLWEFITPDWTSIFIQIIFPSLSSASSSFNQSDHAIMKLPLFSYFLIYSLSAARMEN